MRSLTRPGERESKRKNWLPILTSSAPLLPPKPDEVEVSIFGPGKGESIVMHIGGGEWIIVDSCVDQQSKRVLALEYLTHLGVDIARAVTLVVGTHAHDDHIAGLAAVFDACKSAQFVCAAALTLEEFIQDVNADADIESYTRQSIRAEYREIFKIVKTRPVGRRLKRASEELPLYRRDESSSAPAALVTALSPSSEAFERARTKLANGLARVDQRRRLGGVDPNELAIAILVNVGPTTVLLGADLLRGPNGCGWKAVVATFRPDPPASLFKVPHHGAPNAHHEQVWTQLLSDSVVSILAPYRAGRTPRPAPSDVQRLKSRSKAVYSSANPKLPTPSKAVRKTRAAIGIAQNVRIEGAGGQVQARKASGKADWEVELFPPARQL